MHFGGGSATIEILDAFTNQFRETQLLDLYDITRLEDTLDTMHYVIRACIARDMQEAELLDLNTAYAIMSGTSKHFITSSANAGGTDSLYFVTGSGTCVT